jgi:hypothetical protein
MLRLPSSFMHAVATTPAERLGAFRSLPLPWQPSPKKWRVGFRITCFEACSAFTRVTACMLAKSLKDPLHQRLPPLCHRHDGSDCYRLERKLPACRAHAHRAGHANRQGQGAGHGFNPEPAPKKVLIPPLNVVERICAEAITHATRRLYEALSEPLSDAHRRRLDALLKRRDDGKTTWLAWLRQSPVKPNSRHMLEHIERLKTWQALELPTGMDRRAHPNRLLKMAREGAQMTPADLAKFEPQRRYGTLVALAIEGMATVIDEIIDLHDRILGKLFSVAKKKHERQFQASGKAINAKVRLYGRIGQALIDAKQSGSDPFAAIEDVMSWDAFAKSVIEAQTLAQPEAFDFLHRIGEGYATLRRYTPELLSVLTPRIRDLSDSRLYIPKSETTYDASPYTQVSNLL